MEDLIKDYLTDRDRWKNFINEGGTDFENSTLASIEVDILNQKGQNIEADLSILYDLLENTGLQCASSAKVTLNQEGEIETMERVG